MSVAVARRRWRAGVALLALAWPSALHAVGFELDVHVGRTAPTFEQSLAYDPSSSIPPVPGVTLRPLGPLQLDARGALAFSGSATLYFAGPLGIEARIDGLEADLDTRPAGYDVTLARPPLPFVSARLDLGSEDLRIERVTPVSLNLRVTTPGPVRLSLSGGVTRLDALRLGGTLTGALVVQGATPLSLPAVAVRLVAVAPPDEAEQGQYGVNAGAALQIGLGRTLALSLEARGFVFKKRVLTWSAAGAPANAVEEALQRELLARLEPVRFTPTFFSVNVGLAVRF